MPSVHDIPAVRSRKKVTWDSVVITPENLAHDAEAVRQGVAFAKDDAETKKIEAERDDEDEDFQYSSQGSSDFSYVGSSQSSGSGCSQSDSQEPAPFVKGAGFLRRPLGDLNLNIPTGQWFEEEVDDDEHEDEDEFDDKRSQTPTPVQRQHDDEDESASDTTSIAPREPTREDSFEAPCSSQESTSSVDRWFFDQVD